MGDYNRNKVLAYRIIDDLYHKGKDVNVIIYKINTVFGFGKKIVEDRIELLKSLSIDKKLKNKNKK